MIQPRSSTNAPPLLILMISGALSGLSLMAEEPDPLADPEKFYAERLQDAGIQRVLRLVPRQVSKVYEPPDDWRTLRFDSLELKLPLGTNWFVFITNNTPHLRAQEGRRRGTPETDSPDTPAGNPRNARVYTRSSTPPPAGSARQFVQPVAA